MKKFLAFFASLMIVTILAFTIMAFTDDDPKKQKSETTASANSDSTKTCSQHADATAKEDGKKCCKGDGTTAASGECKKSESCKHEKNTADAATTDKK